jgi:hypothetical protein
MEHFQIRYFLVQLNVCLVLVLKTANQNTVSHALCQGYLQEMFPPSEPAHATHITIIFQIIYI